MPFFFLLCWEIFVGSLALSPFCLCFIYNQLHLLLSFFSWYSQYRCTNCFYQRWKPSHPNYAESNVTCMLFISLIFMLLLCYSLVSVQLIALLMSLIVIFFVVMKIVWFQELSKKSSSFCDSGKNDDSSSHGHQQNGTIPSSNSGSNSGGGGGGNSRNNQSRQSGGRKSGGGGGGNFNNYSSPRESKKRGGGGGNNNNNNSASSLVATNNNNNWLEPNHNLISSTSATAIENLTDAEKVEKWAEIAKQLLLWYLLYIQSEWNLECQMCSNFLMLTFFPVQTNTSGLT